MMHLMGRVHFNYKTNIIGLYYDNSNESKIYEGEWKDGKKNGTGNLQKFLL